VEALSAIYPRGEKRKSPLSQKKKKTSAGKRGGRIALTERVIFTGGRRSPYDQGHKPRGVKISGKEKKPGRRDPLQKRGGRTYLDKEKGCPQTSGMCASRSKTKMDNEHEWSQKRAKKNAAGGEVSWRKQKYDISVQKSFRNVPQGRGDDGNLLEKGGGAL